MIARKYRSIVFAFFMASLVSCLISLVISVLNVGLVDNLFTIWLRAWGFAFVVAFPTIILIAPIVRLLVELVLENE